MKLTEKQKRFADYYIELGNATESALKAGYSKKTARSIGQENLTKPDIKSYIDKRMEELADERIMKAQEALELLTSIARGELTEEVVVSFMDGYEKVEKKPDIKDRQKALESILKRYPTNNQDELKDKLLEEQIKKLQAETERIAKDSEEDIEEIVIVDEWSDNND
jgi:phage terminase small subunit